MFLCWHVRLSKYWRKLLCDLSNDLNFDLSKNMTDVIFKWFLTSFPMFSLSFSSTSVKSRVLGCSPDPARVAPSTGPALVKYLNNRSILRKNGWSNLERIFGSFTSPLRSLFDIYFTIAQHSRSFVSWNPTRFFFVKLWLSWEGELWLSQPPPFVRA